MKIAAGSIVRIEYELRVKGGEVLESSAKTGPIQYTQGEGKLLPALEKRLEGLSAGQSLDGEIPAEEVTPVASLPTKVIPRKEFPANAQIAPKEIFEANTANGPVRLYVTAVDDKGVTVKLLPPLAGKDILFKVKVVMVEDPVSHKRAVVVKKPPPRVVQASDADLEPSDD
jgi:FKBP-type peptidyl-prolyl cis-trans isomerase SlyD